MLEKLVQLERRSAWRQVRELLGKDYPQPRTRDAEAFYWAGATLSFIGKSEGSQDAQAQAIGLLIEAYGLFTDEVRRAECLSKISLCHCRRGKYGEAKDIIKQALELSESFVAQRALFHVNYSIALSGQRQFNAAAEASDEAISLARELSDSYLSGLALMESATVHTFLKLYDIAIALNLRAAKEFSSIPNPYLQSMALNNLADVYLRDGKSEQAKSHLAAAWKLACQLNNGSLLKLVGGTMSECLESVGEAT